MLTANTADDGGGSYQGTLKDCLLSGNFLPINAEGYDGAADSSMLNHCVVSNNSAYSCGGIRLCVANDSLLTGNQGTYGGAAAGCTLNNCIIQYNTANQWGGGTVGSTLNACTLVGNSAGLGGGVYQGTLNNCIVYYNSAPNGSNYSGCTLNYCCTVPLPGGNGNITNTPLFADLVKGDFHLQSNSLCINAGNNGDVIATNDLDGNPRIIGGVVDMGAYEYQTPVPLTVAIQVDNTNVATGFALNFQGTVGRGIADIISWDFGDGTVVTNQLSVSHNWTSPGIYMATLMVSNDFTPGGVSTAVEINAVGQPICYVSGNSTNPITPYSSWDTAATNIQDAINAAYEGGIILVTNGVYQGGNTLTSDGATNRVATKFPVTVESVNGPTVTVISGSHSMRCAYLTDGTALVGFTLTNGTAGTGGGIWCASKSGADVSNCVIGGNSGGGVYQGTFNNCTFVHNSGSGAISSVLTNCTLISNTSGFGGGGAYDCLLVNCVLALNSAIRGGGALSSTLINSAVWGNSATTGGGTSFGILINCSVTGNTAAAGAGGTDGSTETNCIIYYNTARGTNVDNYQQGSASMDHCCTIPASPSVYATATITNEPLLASASHLSLNSPCRGAGNATVFSGVDIDGEPWANPPSIGCDELYPGNVLGDVNVNILTSFTNLPVGYPAYFQANISGPVNTSTWDFGDGTVVSNRPYMTHAWSAVGDYPVVLTAYNDTYPAGQPTTLIMHVYVPTIFYVTITNNTPIAPYDSWAKAATNIQTAIDIASSGNLILVSNGVYGAGSRVGSDGVTDRIFVSKPVTIQSFNGRAVTSIDGGNAMRCVYLTNGAALVGFTVTNGNAANGGGIYCASTNALVANCLIIKNSAGTSGGGTYCGALTNCTIANNPSGGGANSSFLVNCLVSNNAPVGVQGCILNNCLVVSNTGCGARGCVLDYCVIRGNTWNSSGAGASQSVLRNCVISQNTSSGYGGGVGQFSYLTNCLIVGNTASDYPAGQDSTFVNCTIVSNNTANGYYTLDAAYMRNSIVYYNTNRYGLPGNVSGLDSYCCTPLPSIRPGDFTNAPLFVNLAGGDFHLMSNSPCINSGNNANVFVTNDFDGNPRLLGGTVDVGAYEYQTPSSAISYAWLQKYGLPTDGSVDYVDSDGDGLNNWQEWKAGTNPTNAQSVLEMTTATPTNSPLGLAVSWQSVSGITYYLQSSTNLGLQPAFSTVQSNIIGQTGATSFTDTNGIGSGPYFYRVGVQ